MTASERLRELDGEIGDGPWLVHGLTTNHGEAAVILRNALPLIADVVEAAERDLRDGGRANARALAVALTALRDSLETQN